MSLSNQGLRMVIYKVSDLEQAKAWYAKGFGSEPYFDGPFYVGFNIGGYEPGLPPSEKPPESKTVNVSAYWGVEDIDADFNRLLDLGAVESEKPTKVGGPIMAASVKDRWGNALGLIYNPKFKPGP